MTLGERLREAERAGASSSVARLARPAVGRTTPAALAADPVSRLRNRAHEEVYKRFGHKLGDAAMSPDQLHRVFRAEVERYVDESDIPLAPAERERLITGVLEDLIGYGPIRQYLDDPEVTEIMVNSTDSIYIERAGCLHETDDHFASVDHLRRVIDRIVSDVGRRVDELSPMVDARLADGSRVNAIIPPLAVDGPALTIRKFLATMMSADELCAARTVTPSLVEFLERCVRGRVSIVVSGGTGSGKTTLLNMLSSFIPANERLVTIEDSVELKLRHRHLIRLESRPSNIEGRGEVTIRDLVRNALRMRPDRIIVGEVRGAEALDMLQAMNTGHDGSLTTLHANSPHDVLNRLETMVLMAGLELPLTAVRDQIASAVDLIVHVARLSDGSRRVIQVTEVDGMDGSAIRLNDLYTFDFEAGTDEHGHLVGSARPTGVEPGFSHTLAVHGVRALAETPGD